MTVMDSPWPMSETSYWPSVFHLLLPSPSLPTASWSMWLSCKKPYCWWNLPYHGRLSSSTPLLRKNACDQTPQGPVSGRSPPVPVLLMVNMMRSEEGSIKSSPPILILTLFVPVKDSVDALEGYARHDCLRSTMAVDGAGSS